MDANLIGPLVGVVLGSVLTLFVASRKRKWDLQDAETRWQREMEESKKRWQRDELIKWLAEFLAASYEHSTLYRRSPGSPEEHTARINLIRLQEIVRFVAPSLIVEYVDVLVREHDDIDMEDASERIFDARQKLVDAVRNQLGIPGKTAMS